MTISLLPPNASPLERALEGAAARLGDVPVPLLDLWNPATVDADLLPWIGWGLSIDRWEPGWSEAEKRAQVAIAIEAQRRKGTPLSVKTVLASFDQLLTLSEWWQQSPPGVPHTFDIDLPLVGGDGMRAGAAFADAIVREVVRVKPARSHFRLLQTLKANASVGVLGAGRLALLQRDRGQLVADQSPVWLTILQTEEGEPLELETGGYYQEEAA